MGKEDRELNFCFSNSAASQITNEVLQNEQKKQLLASKQVNMSRSYWFQCFIN